MKFPKHYSMTRGDLNLTPLIDVVLLQLIFFMLTSSFIMQPGIKIDLPQAVTTEKIEKREIFVSISKEGNIFYKEKPVSLNGFEKMLSKKVRKNGEIILVIKGDAEAKHGRIVQVMDISRKVGVEKIAIATMPKIKR